MMKEIRRTRTPKQAGLGSLIPEGSFVEQLLNFASNLGNEGVAVADGQAPGLDRRPDPDAAVDRPHEGAALAHRVTSTLNSHRDDGRLGFDGHDETTLLERKQVAGATARALGENQDRVAIA